MDRSTVLIHLVIESLYIKLKYLTERAYKLNEMLTMPVALSNTEQGLTTYICRKMLIPFPSALGKIYFFTSTLISPN